jgi:hypothetical protein
VDSVPVDSVPVIPWPFRNPPEFRGTEITILAGTTAKIRFRGIPGIDRIPPDSGRNTRRTVKNSNTGMWVVRPDHYIRSRRRICTIVHIDSILRAAHLIGASGPSFLPQEISPSDSLHAFKSFYVSKYADHHSYEIAF